MTIPEYENGERETNIFWGKIEECFFILIQKLNDLFLSLKKVDSTIL